MRKLEYKEQAVWENTFEGLFSPTRPQSSPTLKRRKWSLEQYQRLPSCNPLHQAAFPCSCDYYITTWLLTIIATVGEPKAQHGTISIKGIWMSITSSEVAGLLVGLNWEVYKHLLKMLFWKSTTAYIIISFGLYHRFFFPLSNVRHLNTILRLLFA